MITARTHALVVGMTLLLLLVAMAPALPAEVDKPDSANAGVPKRENASEAETGGSTKSAPPAVPPQRSYKAEDWTVALYPVLAWAPIMGGSISLPELPPVPGHPISETGGDVSAGLNGAAVFGLALQKNWFVADISVLWASINATGNEPPVSLDTSVLFYDAFAGVKLHKDVSLVAGVRHMGLKLDATITDHPTVTWKPNVTDPMLGIEYRPSLSKHWGLELALKGGGFGAGSDVDLSGTGRLDWRFARHFGLTMGYGVLHFKIAGQVTTSTATYTRETSQTLHGPIFGFGIYF